jgi:hypothetical protein
MDTNARLRKETEKWLQRLEKEATKAKPAGNFNEKKLDNSMENVRAYIKDCHYFLGKGDLVRAFEAVVYAWGILETLERLGLVEK